MNEQNDDRIDPEEPDLERADGQEAGPGRGRRAFLRGVLGLGLTNVVVSFVGAVPAAAQPQDGDGDCAVPNDDGYYSADTDCDTGNNSPDLDCGKPTGNTTHTDENCNQLSLTGATKKDENCGVVGAGGGWSTDADCSKPGVFGVAHADDDCGLAPFSDSNQQDG